MTADDQQRVAFPFDLIAERKAITAEIPLNGLRFFHRFYPQETASCAPIVAV